MSPFRIVLSSLCLLTACRASATLPPGPAEALSEIAQRPETLGALEYRGLVFVRNAPAADAAPYVYERWVAGGPGRLVANHVTYDRTGDIVVRHRAEHSPKFELRRFETTHAQMGTSGRLDVHGDGSLTFTLTRAGRTRTHTEGPGSPVVTGPTLFGFVAQHFDDLLAGRRYEVRFAVAEEGRSYRFELRVHATGDQTTTVSMRAVSPFVRAAVPDIAMTFDSATRKIVRYEGRVPPLLKRRGRYVPFDGRVEYALHSGGDV